MNRSILTLAVAVAVVVAATGAIGGVAAQSTNETPDYYGNASEPNTDSWFESVDPTTLEGIVTMVSRIGTYVIGGGGTGISGQLLTGVTVAGIGIGSVARANIGGVAGIVLGISALFAGAATGIAPGWVSAVVMFGVGLVLASVFRRVIT